jgi:large subunit ribosomal protein L22
MKKDEHSARATGKDMPISTKHAIEISSMIRGKKVNIAVKMLEEVTKLKRAVPFKRFKRDVGHKRGNIAAGRYPLKASREILELLKSAEMNAQNKGLDNDALFISEIVANKGASQWRYGRQRRRQMKRTNLIIKVEELEKETKKEVKKAEVKKPEEAPKETPKPETKKVEKPKEKKTVKKIVSAKKEEKGGKDKK